MADALPLLKAAQNTCTCRVCFDVLKDPVAFHCGHVLCRSCAERCITARPRCPLCNHSVPNTRHFLPLPQLSLFCVCVREVGLRVQQLQPTTLLRGESKTRKSSDAGVNTIAKRPRRESSPTPPWNAADTLSELLLRSTLSGTQRLHSEPRPEHTPPPRGSVEGGSKLLGGEGEGMGDSTAAPRELAVRDGSDAMRREDHSGSHTSPPPPPVTTITAATSASPAAQTLALLQAHLAEEVEQAELTPRLDRSRNAATTATAADVAAPAPLINMSATSPSDASLPLTATARESLSLWRLWRRGKGIVHCALHPPARRLEAASRARQQPHPQVETSSGMPSSHLPRDTSSAVERCTLSAAEATRFHRAGMCLLCGLDVVQRAAVRQRLQHLLRSAAAHCDPAELAAQTEDSLALLLGPLWSVTCRFNIDAASTDACSRGEGVYTVGREVGSSLHEGQLCGVAHHNCLCWAGLLDIYTDTSSTPAANALEEALGTSRAVLEMTVSMTDPVRLCATHTSGRVARWQLLAATLWRLHHLPTAGDVVQGERIDVGGAVVASRCALCAGLTASVSPMVAPDIFGVGLRSCEGAERGETSCGRHYHYPCALLAGASARIVFGLEEKGNVLRDADDVCVRCAETSGVRAKGPAVEVWCGSCHERHESRHRSRRP